ncbi:bifunctional isocitrate dehydrogenase kinase/phosphatase [Alkalimonas collagenimarina]|uniref:Isocitrate dehydrogenase kinase/phosphatase n=1 Tax=Alkalimonas collagenimarina TaxID=400390 RepID=A0ABT9H3C8_9GAMM|nr:bifunctional isocitrate dehydrogenase kinase/phosphatase [Alkalimonas collagenimarina]MDP4537830.1 bifunctional isocitrate dehydrogenase kinase/phosphatase [Alkalimonas collagenimarina]
MQPKPIAELILKGFKRHFSLFRDSTSEASRYFNQADWQGFQQQSSERISFYDQRVNETLQLLRKELPDPGVRAGFWHEVKQLYSEFLLMHPQAELAETFYNSVFCRLFERKYFHNKNIFVETTLNRQQLPAPVASVYDSYFPVQNSLKQTLRQIIASFHFGPDFIQLDRDIRLLVRSFMAQSSHGQHPLHQIRFDILKGAFYRNKAAYIVGRAVTPQGQQPFIIPVLHQQACSTATSEGLYLDTLITEPQQMSVIFGFSRAYFMVDSQVPSALIQFLRELLPHKTLAELYASIGFHKQGKTEFYRELLQHLHHSSDQFVAAPGIRGLVMMVFTLPSFPYVFKVIRDEFPESKQISRAMVKTRYLQVKKHDRVGRMADTMEYSDVALPKDRFAPELLAELEQSIAGSLRFEDDLVVIKHLYIERRMIPLNLYLEQVDSTEKTRIMKDYGQALKDIIAANIFPGDMLLKNFGVTRHKRVIFYDYDEVQYLLDVNFRTLPKAESIDDALYNEVSVAPGDVFPEQITTYVTAQPELRELLQQHHPELMDASYWQQMQQRIRAGQFDDVFPYPDGMRFCMQYAEDYP